ncbi:MAG: hypothetical protein CO175_01875 [Verrucomicrobia bacterium CG_4_9_14_3_um_filter_43_20]|nr:MAG: hypothetical protein CO175_01875 [Verrucomicrobia bacterium CG_4_9_14_3_um_filter_43_20]
MRLWGMAAQSRHLERLFFLKQSKIIHEARIYENPAFQWTRRLIALSAVFSIVVFPKLVAVFLPEIPIHLGYPQLSGGFLFFFCDIEKIKWVELSGLVITPIDTHLVAAIIGLYFGGSFINVR